MCRRVLFVLSQIDEPLIAEETLDALLVAAAFELDVTLLLEGDSVRMVGDPDVESRLAAVHTKLLSLADFGVHSIHACARSVERLNVSLNNPDFSIVLVARDSYHSFLASFEAVIPG